MSRPPVALSLLLALLPLLAWAAADAPALELYQTDQSYQSYRYEQWGVERSPGIGAQWDIATGLPQISVQAMAMGPDGLLWLGTENGLARFDGLQFQIFNSRNTPALSSNWIDALFTDSEQRLWIATAGGVLLREGGRFASVMAGSAGLRVSVFAQTADGQLWAGGSGLWQISSEGVATAPLYNAAVTQLAATAAALWWVGEDNALRFYHKAEVQRVDSALLAGAAIAQLVAAEDAVWLLADGRVVEVRLSPSGAPALRALPPLPDSNEQLIALSLSSPDGLLAVSSSGLAYALQLDGTDAWARLPLPSDIPLSNGKLTLLAAEQRLWVGTATGGLHAFWPTVITREAPATPFAKTRVWSFFTDDSVYAATDDGVFRRESLRQWERVVAPAQIDGKVAYSYWHDGSAIWVGTRSGLYRRDRGAERFVQQAALGERQVNSLVQDGDVLWIGTNRGLFQHWRHSERMELIDALGEQAVRAVYRDRGGRVWAGSEAGLFVYDAGVWAAVPLPVPGSVFVGSIFELPGGELGLASYGEGLFVRSDSGQWRQLTTADGMPFQNLFNVVVAADTLWVSSGSGVFSLQQGALEQGAVRADVHLRDDGTFAQRERLRCCNGAGNRRSVMFAGRLFLPTLEGVLSLPLHGGGRASPQPVISAVMHQEQSLDWSEQLKLPAQMRDINIAFTVPRFGREDLPEYRYRLLPSDQNWTYTGGRQVAYFNKLPPGESVFELQARLGSGEWQSGLGLNILADRRLSETWVFRMLAVLAVLALLWLALQARTQQLRARAAALEAQVAVRTADYERVNEQLLASNRELQRAAVTDALTGLHNRRFMQEQLPSLLAAINRRHQAAKGQAAQNPPAQLCAILIMDIDRFKDINDSLGHDRGDLVLVATARALADAVRADNYLLRWGGEEFVLVIPDIAPAHLPQVHQRLHAAMEPVAEQTGLWRPLTLSIGLVCLPWGSSPVDVRTWEHALELADLGLYAAKAAGRNATAIVHTRPELAELAEWSREAVEHARRAGYWSYEIVDAPQAGEARRSLVLPESSA